MQHKTQALPKSNECFAEDGPSCILRSDNGTEYTNNSIKQFCTNNQINREHIVPETQEQKGAAERHSGTVVETAWSHMTESKLPKSYWLRAVDTATSACNLVKTNKTEKSPYRKFWARKPKTGDLKVFGCLVYTKVKNVKSQSLIQKRGSTFS